MWCDLTEPQSWLGFRVISWNCHQIRLVSAPPVCSKANLVTPGCDEEDAAFITGYQARIAKRNVNNLRYADDTTLKAESKEELKSILMKVKEESEKVSLKLNIQIMKIMAFGPITSWQIDGETMETMTDFILGGSKIIADGDCSHEIKRYLLLGRKAMTNLDSILKSRDITDKGPSGQSYGFSSTHAWR